MENRIGSVIRINRLVQNISLRELAIIIGIEYSQLSKIERGIESTNDFIMDSIFSSLDLDYESVKEFLKEDERYFNQLYKALLYRRSKNQIYELLEEYNQLIKENCATIENVIINIMFRLLWGEDLDKVKELLKVMREMDQSLSQRYLQYYYQYVGYYYFLNGKIDKALEFIDKIKFGMMDRHTYGLMLYMKGLILARYSQYFESYEVLMESKKILDEYNNYIRSAFCSVSMANIYLLTEKYSQALEMYKDLLEVYDNLKLSNNDKALICDNMLLICILTEQFDLFFLMINGFDEEIVHVLQDRPRYLYYRISALYNTKRYTECLECIQRFNGINTNKNDKYVISYYKMKMSNQDTSKVIKVLERNLKVMDKTKDFNGARFLLNLLLKEYEEIGDYEKLYHYALKLTELHP